MLCTCATGTVCMIVTLHIVPFLSYECRLVTVTITLIVPTVSSAGRDFPKEMIFVYQVLIGLLEGCLQL